MATHRIVLAPVGRKIPIAGSDRPPGMRQVGGLILERVLGTSQGRNCPLSWGRHTADCHAQGTLVVMRQKQACNSPCSLQLCWLSRLPGLKDLLNTDLFLSVFRLHHPDSSSSPSVVIKRDYIWLICMKNVIIAYPSTCAIWIIFSLQLFLLSNHYAKELRVCIFYDLQ